MIRLLFEVIFLTPTALWGWVSLALLGMVVAIPYVRRSAVAVKNSDTDAARPYLSALALHYWVAPAVLIVSFLHAWIPMAAGRMPHTSMRGLWLATYALGLIFVQLLMGLALRYAGPRGAKALRRVHFILMLGIAALVISHLWLNGPFSAGL
jgi:hypothetical protein